MEQIVRPAEGLAEDSPEALQLCSKFSWSLSNLVALLRMNLFTHRDLWAWLNHPFDVLPIPYGPEQLKLALV